MSERQFEVCLAAYKINLGPIDNEILGGDLGHTFLIIRDAATRATMMEVHGFGFDPAARQYGFGAHLSDYTNIITDMARAAFKSPSAALSGDPDCPKLKTYAVSGDWLTGKKEAEVTPLFTIGEGDVPKAAYAMANEAAAINRMDIDFNFWVPNDLSANCQMASLMILNRLKKAFPEQAEAIDRQLQRAEETIKMPGLHSVVPMLVQRRDADPMAPPPQADSVQASILNAVGVVGRSIDTATGHSFSRTPLPLPVQWVARALNIANG